MEFTIEALPNKFCLYIDKAHLLLLHSILIVMTREFNYVELIVATPND